MKNKQVLFFDIDGTLLTPGKRIVEDATVEVLKELSTNPNIDMYISSGRGRETLLDVEYIIPYFTGLNLANGGHIIIGDKDYKFTIDKTIVTRLVTYMIEHKISFAASTSTGNVRMYFDEETKKVFDNNVPTPYTLLKETDDFYFDDVIQFWLLAFNDVIDETKKLFPELTFFKWSNWGADVIPNNRDKATGIKKIIEIMNYDFKNTFAFGDSDNDVPMFKVCNISVAMGKCTLAAKNNATYIADFIENAGLAKAIKKYVIKKEL